MEFRDLNAQYQALKGGIDAGIARVLEHGRYIGGPEVAELEARLAAYVGARHCITCANGTDALQLALMAWGVGPGDAVFVPDFTFFASGEAPALLGAMPVFVDVDERTFNLDPAKLEEAVRFVEDGTDLAPRVVVAVDLFGLPADYTAIREVCERHRMLLPEDGAQGFGGSIGSRMACSFGDVSTTSFFPAKPLGCYGDGGAVFTDNDEWAELVRSYAVHGKGSMKYDNVRVGVNSRLDTAQAAVLLAKASWTPWAGRRPSTPGPSPEAASPCRRSPRASAARGLSTPCGCPRASTATPCRPPSRSGASRRWSTTPSPCTGRGRSRARACAPTAAP